MTAEALRMLFASSMASCNVLCEEYQEVTDTGQYVEVGLTDWVQRADEEYRWNQDVVFGDRQTSEE